MEGHDTTCTFAISLSALQKQGEWGEVKAGKTREEAAALTRIESDVD